MKNSASEALYQAVQPGETLRKAREQRGFAVDEVAAQLNLTVERVHQIEQEQWHLLPGLTFARGYLRLYARLLELDADALVEQFNLVTSSLPESEVLSDGLHSLPPRRSLFSLRLLSLLVLVVLLVGGFLWWEGHAAKDKAPPTTAPMDWPLELEGGTDEPLEDELPLLPPPDAEHPPATATDNPAAIEQPAASETTHPPALEDNVPAPPREGVLRFNFAGDCWLQVKDGYGQVLFSGILNASDTLELSGTPPLELRLGNPRAVKLSYNGEPVPITAATSRLMLGP